MREIEKKWIENKNNETKTQTEKERDLCAKCRNEIYDFFFVPKIYNIPNWLYDFSN